MNKLYEQTNDQIRNQMLYNIIQFNNIQLVNETHLVIRHRVRNELYQPVCDQLSKDIIRTEIKIFNRELFERQDK